MSFSGEPTCSSKVGELMKPSWRCIRTLNLRKHLKIAGKMDAHLLKYGMLDLTNSCNSIVHNLQKNPNKKITNCTIRCNISRGSAINVFDIKGFEVPHISTQVTYLRYCSESCQPLCESNQVFSKANSDGPELYDNIS